MDPVPFHSHSSPALVKQTVTCNKSLQCNSVLHFNANKQIRPDFVSTIHDSKDIKIKQFTHVLPPALLCRTYLWNWRRYTYKAEKLLVSVHELVLSAILWDRISCTKKERRSPLVSAVTCYWYQTHSAYKVGIQSTHLFCLAVVVSLDDIAGLETKFSHVLFNMFDVICWRAIIMCDFK
jgi:hypothetical protein